MTNVLRMSVSEYEALVAKRKAASTVRREAGKFLLFSLPIKLESLTNKREHWAAKSKRAKEQRTNVANACRLHNCGAGRIELPCTVTITRVGVRSLDSDNLAISAKHARDGVADAFGIDDASPLITWRVEQRKGAPREYAVEIRIEARA